MSGSIKASVKMIIRVGKDEVPLGECHPAEARNLVKKEYASWNEGKLLILGRPAFLRMMESSEHWIMPYERGEISERELDRRKSWFRDFMSQAVKVTLKSIDPAPRIVLGKPYKAKKNFTPEELLEADLSEEEAELFRDIPDLDPADLTALWETAPDISQFFFDGASLPSRFMSSVEPKNDQEVKKIALSEVPEKQAFDKEISLPPSFDESVWPEDKPQVKKEIAEAKKDWEEFKVTFSDGSKK